MSANSTRRIERSDRWIIGSDGLISGVAISGLVEETYLASKAQGDLADTAVQAATDPLTGRIAGLIDNDGGTIAVRGSTKYGRCVFVGDSLTQGGSGRKSRYFDGLCTWSAVTFNGAEMTAWGGQYVWIGYVRPAAAGTGSGVLHTDGAGRLQWKAGGDSNYGPYVDVSLGGFFNLESGDNPTKSCWVTIRGNSAYPVADSILTVTTGGTKTLQDHSLIGYVSWVAGALGDTFEDYQQYGIGGSTSADVLKFMPQACEQPGDVCVILVGVNDATLADIVSNTKAAVALALPKFARVYVVDIFPAVLGGGAAAEKRLTLASLELKDWCRAQPRVRFCSSFDYMIEQTTYSESRDLLRTGAFHSDYLHLRPFGAYWAAKSVVAAISQDFSVSRPRIAYNDQWDTTERTGHWGWNPLFRGSGGTVAGAGVTGTCPNRWTIDRSGATQTVTTAHTTVDSGLPFYSLAVAAATAGDYHKVNQTVNVAGGVAAGEYFQVSVEIYIGAMTGTGLSILQATATGTGSAQAAVVFDCGRDVANFNTELPVLHLKSEPQKLLAGTTQLDCEFRVGAAAGGGAGIVGIRQFRVDRCDGPIYP